MNGPLSGFDRVAEDLGELRPVRDPHRRVDRARPARARRTRRSRFRRPRSASTATGPPRRRRPGSGRWACHSSLCAVLSCSSSLSSAPGTARRDPPRRRAPGIEDLHLGLVPRPEDHLRVGSAPRGPARPARARPVVRGRARPRRARAARRRRRASSEPSLRRRPRRRPSSSTRAIPSRAIGSRLPSRTRGGASADTRTTLRLSRRATSREPERAAGSPSGSRAARRRPTFGLRLAARRRDGSTRHRRAPSARPRPRRPSARPRDAG